MVADNSSRGIVMDLMGVTFDFPASNIVMISLKINVMRMYIAAAYATEDASAKLWNSHY